MPGTVAKSFDPTIIVTTASTTATEHTPKATVEPSAQLPASSAVTPQPLSHPASGVASFGPSTVTANASHTAALSEGNPGAIMTSKQQQQLSPPSVSKDEDREQEVALKKFVETKGHFSLVRNFRLADAFTIMNAFCAAQSFFNSAKYLATGDTKYIWFALWCPLFGAIFDLLDGKVARWRGGGSMLGQELDSLADSISFGAAPCVAAFALGLRTTLDTFVLTMFICAGVARLARFNVTTALIPHDASGKARYFEGLPIPTSLILVGGMAACLLFGKFEGAEMVRIGSSQWQFTNRLVSYVSASQTSANAPASKLGLVAGYHYGVPFGKATISLQSAAKLVGLKLTGSWVEEITAEFHWVSLIWLGWAVAMVSKTLRVPKP